MGYFLELLDAICGHDNTVTLHVHCVGVTFSLVLHITGYVYLQAERALKLATDSLDFGTIWFRAVEHLERGEETDDEPDYRFEFAGGQAELTFDLY